MPITLDISPCHPNLSSAHVKTLRQITDEAQTACFQEVITLTGGNWRESARLMGISVPSYYRLRLRLFPKSTPTLGPLCHPSEFPCPPVPQGPEDTSDKFLLSEDDLAPGLIILVRHTSSLGEVTDVDWANREVDYTVGPMRKRQTIEAFLKHHTKAMV